MVVDECMLARISLIFTHSPSWYEVCSLKCRGFLPSLFAAISLFRPKCDRAWTVRLNHNHDLPVLRRCAYVPGLTNSSSHPGRAGHAAGKDEALCPSRCTTQP